MSLSEPEILKSEIDSSVNFVWKQGNGQAIEARYVRRHPEYVACYLSSQTACEQACRFCHLTATGQNKPEEVQMMDLVWQADKVLSYYKEVSVENPAQVVHYNFMARGEPMSNPFFVHTNQPVLQDLAYCAMNYELLPRFLISTIMPESLDPDKPLREYFPVIQPEIYYSLYTLRREFRRRWLPRAMDPMKALRLLADWQQHSKKIIRIHHALIKDKNDGLGDAEQILTAVEEIGLRVDFTLVRYNPPTERDGQESNQYEDYAGILRHSGKHRVKVIQRVGFDVAASCGMFVNP